MNTTQEPKYAPLGEEEEDFNSFSTNERKSFHKYRYLPSFKWLLIILLNFLALLVIWRQSRRSSQQCGLPSDIVFGNIPWREVVIENDERFIATQPEPEYNESEPRVPSIWDDLWPGTWVAIDNPKIGGANGRGMKMNEVGMHRDEWSETSEGFGIAVMHQLHCVMSVKQTIMDFMEDRDMSRHVKASVHLQHCLEILRQAVMCHGDLTLETPVKHDGREGVTGWGNVHMCRDWDMVHQAILERRITRSQHGGWLDTSKKEI